MVTGQQQSLPHQEEAPTPQRHGPSPNNGRAPAEVRVSTGVAGLDEVLYGGLVTRRAYLVRGGPGSGKTTLGLHFLTEGVSRGEQSLFITLGEPEEELRAN